MLSAGDTVLGPVRRAARLRGTVVLRPRDAPALARFIASVTDHSSPRFGDYLRPGRFAARFGPTSAARTAVIAALRGDGLHVGRVSSDGLLIPFGGEVAQVEHAFDTSIDAVRLPDGATAHANRAPISLPSSVGGSVEAVLGLDDTAEPHRIGGAPQHHDGRRHGNAAAVQSASAGPDPGPVACPAATHAAIHDDGLTDPEIADAYGAGDLYAEGDDGAGQHIAVYELEPFLRSDIAVFDTCYFGSARAAAMLRRLHVERIAGGQPYGTGKGEANLDIEDLSAIAPGADLDVYIAPQTDALGAYAAIVDTDRDRIVSTSWGECEQAAQQGNRGLQQAENLLFEQAAAQGQTVFAAAGDSGSDDCTRGVNPSTHANPISVDDPASQPYVVGVGGTAIDDTGTGRPLEHVWNDGTAFGAGGGGISQSWTMTAWQQDARVPGIALPGGTDYRRAAAVERATGYSERFCSDAVPAARAGLPCRLVPDVSAQADEFTGAITVYSRSYRNRHNRSGWTTTGGTSSATPIWAASLALVNASPACTEDATTRAGVGFAAPLLYAVASDPATYAASFTDVRTGDNDVHGLDDGTVYSAGPGYDVASGLGSPQLAGAGGVPGLATYLCEAAARRAAPNVRSLTPATGAARGGGPLVIRGDGFTLHGHSQVASVQIGDRRIPASRLTVRSAHALSLALPSARAAVPPATSDAEQGYGPVTVLVTLRDGTSSAPGPRAVFHYLARAAGAMTPTVGMLAPYGGPERGRVSVSILGTGFRHVTAVTFGGLRASHVRVMSPERITLTPPARTARTRCTPFPHRRVYAEDTPDDDVCQVEVRVHEPGRMSPRAQIRAPLEGPQLKDALGDLRAHRGCECETAPASDEYDYLPRPHVSSVSTHAGAGSLADEHGGTLVIVHGRGLNPIDLDWADFGDPRRFTSEHTTYVFATGTELELRAPAHALTAGAFTVHFSVRSLAGQSNAQTVRYAGVPAISAVLTPGNPRNLQGVYGAPDTGRTPLVIHGRGMSDQVIGLEFIGQGRQSFSLGSQYITAPGGGGTLHADTVAENPAVVAVEPCTVTGCTKPGHHNLLTLYAPGTPTVDTLTPASGPPAGGTVTSISGENLGCPLSVAFGTVAATALRSVKTPLDCGSTQTLTASAPPGAVGSSVPVTVTTEESFYTGSAPRSSARFTYG